MTDANPFDHFTHYDWEMTVSFTVGLLVLILTARKLGLHPFGSQFPRLGALVELILVPTAVILLGSSLRIAASLFGLADIDQDLRSLTVILTYLVISLVLARSAELFIFARSDEVVEHRLSGLKRGLFYTGFLFVGLAIYLKVHGYSITGVWVSTGVVAALVGFALQRTLGDLFAGIAISIERPFELGDWIEIGDGSLGQVIDLNWRATRLRGWDNTTLVVPNSELASRTFKNLHGSKHRYSPWYTVRISGEINPRLAKGLLTDAVLRCRNVLKHPAPVIRISDASTQPYEYMIWVTFRNYPSMFAGREELYREIHYALERAGVQIAPEIHEWQARKARIPQVEPPNILLTLRGLDFAGEFTEEELEMAASASRYISFDAGTTILKEGEMAVGIDIISSGIVEGSIFTPDGTRRVVDQLGPGEYFGISSLLTSEPVFLQIDAQTDVTVIRIGMDCVRKLLADKPQYTEDLATIVKQRADAAEHVRAACRQRPPKLSFQDILRRIETSLEGRQKR